MVLPDLSPSAPPLDPSRSKGQAVEGNRFFNSSQPQLHSEHMSHFLAQRSQSRPLGLPRNEALATGVGLGPRRPGLAGEADSLCCGAQYSEGHMSFDSAPQQISFVAHSHSVGDHDKSTADHIVYLDAKDCKRNLSGRSLSRQWWS